MSTFDPNSFLNTEVNEANATAYTPVPEGEYPASIKKLTPRVLTDGRAVIDVSMVIDDADVREETGMAEPLVRYTLWLDLTDSGTLDFGKGKNVGLGRLRDALGQNISGKPWQPGMLIGGVCKAKVTHSIDKRDGVTVQANVSAVSPL